MVKLRYFLIGILVVTSQAFAGTSYESSEKCGQALVSNSLEASSAEKENFSTWWSGLWENQGIKNEGWATFVMFLLDLNSQLTNPDGLSSTAIRNAFSVSPHQLESSLGMAAWMLLYVQFYQDHGVSTRSLEMDRRFIKSVQPQLSNPESNLEFLRRVFSDEQIDDQDMSPEKIKEILKRATSRLHLFRLPAS